MRRSARPVGGIKDQRTIDGAEHGQVFEPHLRGAVFAYGYAAVGAAKLYIAATYGGHADLIVGAGEEAGEGVEERRLAAGGQTDSGADQICSAM